MALIYFQKIQSLDFFHHLSLENSEKYWPVDTGLVKFWQRDLLLFCVLHFNVFWTCPLSDFNFCLQVSLACSKLLFYQISRNSKRSGSLEINAFPLTRAVTIFWLTVHALHLTGFSIFLEPYKQCQKGRVFSNSITFNALKNKRFWHITNCLIVKTKKRLHNLQWTLWNVRCTGAMFVFLKALCTRAYSRQQYKS